MKAFYYDSAPMRFTNLLFDLTKLNLLWLACSIPIVTMGAATAAMYSTAGKLKDGSPAVFKNFKEAFRQHFRQSTIIWVIFLILAFAFFMDYNFLTATDIPGRKIFIVVSVLAFVTLMFLMLWIYAVMATYRGTVAELAFNAFIFSFLYTPLTLMAVAVYAIAGYLFISFLPARVLCVVFGHALIVYINLTLYRMGFKRHANEQNSMS